MPPPDATHYRLYLQSQTEIGTEVMGVFRQKLESELGANPHYNYARQLNQLGPIEIKLLEFENSTAWQRFEDQLVRRGMRLGGIKPKSIDSSFSSVEIFEGKSGD